MTRAGLPATCLRQRNLLVKPEGKRKVPDMQTRRLCASLLALVLLPAARADVAMTVSVDKAFYQQDAFRLDFDQGRFDVRIRDGFVFLALNQQGL